MTVDTESENRYDGLPWKATLQHPGAMHRQSTWRERALDQAVKLPLWLRLSYLAFAHHRGNGHATFRKDELRGLLNTDDRQLRRALADAKLYGYLDAKSSARCLIVNPTHVSQGIGHPKDPCRYCGKSADQR